MFVDVQGREDSKDVEIGEATSFKSNLVSFTDFTVHIYHYCTYLYLVIQVFIENENVIVDWNFEHVRRFLSFSYRWANLIFKFLVKQLKD